MSIRRFVCEGELRVGRISLCGDEFFHLGTVLRAEPGVRIELTDGCGRLGRAVVVRMGRHEAEVEVEEVSEAPRPAPAVVVAVSLIKGHAMNWMVEKLSELGVDEIQPLVFRRTDVPAGDSSLRRWQKIAVQSLKVNRRLWACRVHEPAPLATLLDGWSGFAQRLMLDITADTPLSAAGARPLLLLVGPPGDFCDEERGRLTAAGFLPRRLNRGVLKTETAAIAAAAVVQND